MLQPESSVGLLWPVPRYAGNSLCPCFTCRRDTPQACEPLVEEHCSRTQGRMTEAYSWELGVRRVSQTTLPWPQHQDSTGEGRSPRSDGRREAESSVQGLSEKFLPCESSKREEAGVHTHSPEPIGKKTDSFKNGTARDSREPRGLDRKCPGALLLPGPSKIFASVSQREALSKAGTTEPLRLEPQMRRLLCLGRGGGWEGHVPGLPAGGEACAGAGARLGSHPGFSMYMGLEKPTLCRVKEFSGLLCLQAFP